MRSSRLNLARSLVLGFVALVAATQLLLINQTPSVRTGFYLSVEAHEATHITFCLPKLPLGIRAPEHLCDLDDRSGRPVLKRLIEQSATGALVQGDPPRPLDSQLLGVIPTELIQGHFRRIPLL